jgi:predicted transglutaminase-like cysteine proteinase
MMFTALLIAAATTFCAEHPAERACTDAPVIESAISDEQRAQIETLAGQIRLGSARYAGEGNGDRWAAIGPGHQGDCEDRLLWAARELEAFGLGGSYRFVALEEGVEYAGTQRIRRMHLVLVIEAQGGRIVLDTQHRTPRAWEDYAGRRAFTPTGGLGGRWESY